jgi:hypothetical protein
VSESIAREGNESAVPGVTDQSTNQRSDEPPFVGGGSEPGGGGGQSQPGDPGVGGDQPITDDPIDVAPIGPGAGDALPVQPEPGIVDARPHAWDHIDVAADGRTITIYYWGGVETCYGLARVDASVGVDGLLHVTVFEGQRGNLGPNVACIGPLEPGPAGLRADGYLHGA